MLRHCESSPNFLIGHNEIMTEMLIRRLTDSMTVFINVDANLGRHPVRRLTDQGLSQKKH